MKIIGAKFKDTVRIPGVRPSEELSARTSKGVDIDQAGGLLVVSATVNDKVLAVGVPLSNVAYIEFEAEAVEGEKKGKKA